MTLHPDDESLLSKTIAELERIHGSGLLAVVLYGDAAGPSYRARVSILSVAVLIGSVTPTSLEAMSHYIRRWRRRRIGTPLVFDPLYLATSTDAFPIEFLDIRDRHRLLLGRADPFADIAINRDRLRVETEEQIRGKMLHLWEAYMSAGRSNRRLRGLLVASAPGFEKILRGMLYLADSERPAANETLIATVQDTFAIELPTLIRLERFRGGHERLRRTELRSVFSKYLDEIRRLVDVADKL